MSATVATVAGVERFRAAIARHFGLLLADDRLAILDELLRQRAAANSCSQEAYLARLSDAVAPGAVDPREMRALAQELTIGETYFFRNSEQFRALVEVVLPERLRTPAVPGATRILSAGCATGEEPYSIAIVAREAVRDPAWDLSIVGVDVNPVALERARRGRYSRWALRETPPEVQSRWFRAEGRDVVLDESIRQSVRLVEQSLVRSDAQLWMPGGYDVVFLRNVVMYMTPAFAKELIARVVRALAPGGFLFLGHAESLRGLSEDFLLHSSHGTFYWQKREGGEAPAPAPTWSRRGALARAPVPAIDALIDAPSWVDAIQGASDRIRRLAETPDGRDGGSPAAATTSWDVSRPLELLLSERLDDALDCVEAMPAAAASDPDVLLLHAALLTHRGRIERARETCRRLLERDEANAGAHYLLALCHEAEGERGEAAGHDRRAAEIDPTFAMPRLHLGLLARRDGDFATARREFDAAHALLEREEGSRILLFGGGFPRQALLALCRGSDGGVR